MTNTTSDFGREIDSLADVISFGIAPADPGLRLGRPVYRHGIGEASSTRSQRAGKFLAFLFLICGAARLARFNIQKNPSPRIPARRDRKYFVGLPIPAAAGMVAAVVYRVRQLSPHRAVLRCCGCLCWRCSHF